MHDNRIYIYFKRFYLFLLKEKILRLLGVITILVLFCSLGITYFEDITFLNALWWSFVTLTTVGYGDIAPTTWGGRIIGIIMMFFGIGVLGLFTATMATIFVEKRFKEERGWGRVMVEDHIIICGWNFRAKEIIQEISKVKDISIVLLADIDRPIEDDSVYFIQGAVTEDNLIKANIEKAKTVIILLDDRLDEYTRDAKTILNTLTVKATETGVYTCIELANAENIIHCKRAKADEIIVGDEYSIKLITQAAVNHGITLVISEILSKKYGNNLYKIPIPESLADKTFLELLTMLKQKYDCLIVAVQSLANNIFMTNPPADYVMQNGDQIILISNNSDNVSKVERLGAHY